MKITLWKWLANYISINTHWLDRSGNSFDLIGVARLHVSSSWRCHEGAKVCIYRGSDMELHAMPDAEFHDGRFRQSPEDYCRTMM